MPGWEERGDMPLMQKTLETFVTLMQTSGYPRGHGKNCAMVRPLQKNNQHVLSMDTHLIFFPCST